MDDNALRDSAIDRLKARREFFTHLLAYVVVNGFLISIWAWTTGGYFWPMWPLLGWGIGLVFHAWETFRSPISEARIQQEMDKLRGQP